MPGLDAIDSANRRCLEEAAAYRARLAEGTAHRVDLATLKHRYPYYGLVPCRAADVDFVMLQAQDDVVAWKYLWFGDDAHEPRLVRQWVRWARAARTVLDIGAYTGLMSVLAATVNPEARVHAFEPQRDVQRRTDTNLRLNRVLDQVRLRTRALSDRSGSVEMYRYRKNDVLGSGNTLEAKDDLRVRSTTVVRRAPLDTLMPQVAPDLVKIDTEGHELAVLRGAEQAFRRGRPNLLVEVWEHTRDEVLALLSSWGYEAVPYEKRVRPVMNFACTAR
ncbi:MAG: hypothetical protein CMH83_17470 [Nocardioides sp.]|nr:hypothetical protein [Nocardioides sp.]